MIRFEEVTAHAAPHSISKVTLELGPGRHAIVGAPHDGVSVLLAVAAGWVRPRAGRVTVFGRRPDEVRSRIAYVPLGTRLPRALRVAEVLETAARIRGEPVDSPRRRLEVLGVAPLADRPVGSLTGAEARAVLLAEAVTSKADVLLIDEPSVDVDPRAARALPGALREKAGSGAIVVVGTASPRDAFELGDDQTLFSLGWKLAPASHTRTPLLAARTGTLRVVAANAHVLLGALVAERQTGEVSGAAPPSSFLRLELDGQTLVLTGRDPAAMAEAVGRAALASGAEIEAMRLDLPTLEELQRAAHVPASASVPPPAPDPREGVTP